MINTILFDVDGSLLLIDTENFLQNYMQDVAQKVEGLLSQEKVISYFWESTEAVIKNKNPNKTNEEVFFENLFERADVDEKLMTELLEDFYENDFNNVERLSSINKEMVESVKILKEKGYNLVVATNPLFPKQAMRDRLVWAGLDPEDFSFIPSFEYMHFCKPEVEFFEEILEKIDKKPSNCLMVGNHTEEDMVAKQAGITTYLLTNNCIGDLNDKNIDIKGSYNEFLEYTKNLPEIK